MWQMIQSVLESMWAFSVGVAASGFIWWFVWRGMSPRLGISPQVTRKPNKLHGSRTNSYRFKVKNLRVNQVKHQAMEMTYYAYLSYKKVKRGEDPHDIRFLYNNWASIRLDLATRGRPFLMDNVLISFKKHRPSKETRAYLDPPAEGDLLTIHELLSRLPEARIRVSCLATDSYSGSRRGFTKTYGINDIVIGRYKSSEVVRLLSKRKRPPGPWRLWFNTKVRKQVHPELELYTENEERHLEAEHSQTRGRPSVQ